MVVERRVVRLGRIGMELEGVSVNSDGGVWCPGSASVPFGGRM